MPKPLVNKKFLLEKFPGKGGWTFARIPKAQLKGEQRTRFGWVKVKGSVDTYELKQYNLMPMGNGELFLPVKAEIRKQIKKRAGDYVHVILYPDNDLLEVPGDLLLCLHDEPAALQFFNTLSQSEQRYYVNWITGAKREETKVNRITKTLGRLIRGLKFYEWDEK